MVASKDTLNPTHVGGGRVFSTPYHKIAITPEINYPCELTFGDFSYISMTNTPIPFRTPKQAKNRGFQHFLSSDVLKQPVIMIYILLLLFTSV